MPLELFGKRDIKMDPKRNALFEVKLLSRDKVIHIHCKMHMLMFHYDITCVTASIVWRKPMIPGNSWKFEHKGVTEQMKLIVSIFHENQHFPWK